MQPTNAALQVLYGTLPLIGAIMLAAWTNNARLSDMSKRMDDLREAIGKRIDDLGHRIDDLSSRVSDLGKGTRLIQR